MQLNQLISAIQATHDFTQGFAVQQVNSALTIRNWMVGFYIVEYEQSGEDRAQYGAKLLLTIAKAMKSIKIRGLDERSLRDCRAFYQVYPQIWGTVSPKLQEHGNRLNEHLLAIVKKLDNGTSINQIEQSFPPEILLSRLSFSHFIELLRADTPLKRAFYEVQAITNNWGVRELERAISTLLFERTGLSTDKEAMLEKMKGSMLLSPADVVKNPVLLEFLGLQEKPEYSETDMEQAIITHLQMNVYLNYYRKNEMTQHDNPPVGIILCADKDDSLVEYATIDMPHEVFVAKYLVELPSVEDLKRLIDEDRQQILKNH